MKSLTARRTFLVFLMLLAAAIHSYAQTSAARAKTERKAVSYSFVSPNTREGLNLEEAVRMLGSPEESRLVRAINRLSRCLGFNPDVSRAVGSWKDGAEHSTLFKTFADQPTVRYEAARLGNLWRQKSALYFRQKTSGAGVLYILKLWRGRLSLASIAKKLDENGVEFRTLVPGPRRRALVYVADLKRELRAQVVAASRRLRARLISIKGEGEFIGDDTDRDKAAQVFLETIKDYEGGHPSEGQRCARVH